MWNASLFFYTKLLHYAGVDSRIFNCFMLKAF
jgi:hypothetical protein